MISTHGFHELELDIGAVPGGDLVPCSLQSIWKHDTDMSQLTEQATSATAEAKEHRSSPRHRFPYVQAVGPMIDGKVPPKDNFFSVRCKDLSGGGISIVLDNKPKFDHLVVALGVAPNLSHVTAKVVRVELFDDGGCTRYLVGCRFIGRVQL